MVYKDFYLRFLKKIYNLTFLIRLMLSSEQLKQIKEQLLKQLSNFPEDKREEIKSQILQMNDEQFEEFLIENGLIKNSQEEQIPKKSEKNSCLFCSIIQGQIPSYKIDENKDSIAILEINPLSKGHSLILPKKHIETEKIPSACFKLAKNLAKKIKSKFSPKEIKITTLNNFGHTIIEVLPLYGDEKERHKANEKELFELQSLLITKPKIKREKPIKKQKKEEKSNLPKLKPRLP